MPRRVKPSVADMPKSQEREFGELTQAVFGLQNGMRDLRQEVKDLKQENSDQHRAGAQRIESLQRVMEEKFSSVWTQLDSINQTLAQKQGAEGVYRYMWHGLTAVISSGVAAAMTFLLKAGGG